METTQDPTGDTYYEESVIENCPMAFECPKTWESLAATDAPDVRHCDACGKDVTFCADPIKLQQMADAGACVAFYVRRKREIVRLMGLPRTDPPKRKRKRKGGGDDRLRSFIDSL